MTLIARSEDKLEAAKKELEGLANQLGKPARILTRSADTTDAAAVKTAVTSIVQEAGEPPRWPCQPPSPVRSTHRPPHMNRGHRLSGMQRRRIRARVLFGNARGFVPQADGDQLPWGRSLRPGGPAGHGQAVWGYLPGQAAPASAHLRS